jgi:hypothetical protein
LQLGCFGHRGGFREGDEHQAPECRVLEAHERGGDAAAVEGGVLHHLAMERAGDVEQQQGAPGGGGVDHDVLGAADAEEAAEGAEDRDFGGAGRAQIFGSEFTLGVAGAAQLFGGVALSFGVRVDPADRDGVR